MTFEEAQGAYMNEMHLKVQVVAKSELMNTHHISKPVLEELNWS